MESRKKTDAMKNITLFFSIEEDLRHFISIITGPFMEINLQELTVKCCFNDSEIEMAERDFFARAKFEFA